MYVLYIVLRSHKRFKKQLSYNLIYLLPKKSLLNINIGSVPADTKSPANRIRTKQMSVMMDAKIQSIQWVN